jgi:hypothetical protein
MTLEGLAQEIQVRIGQAVAQPGTAAETGAFDFGILNWSLSEV